MNYFRSKQFYGMKIFYFKPFVPNALFPYPLKTSENLMVFFMFSRVEKGCIGNKWVNYELSITEKIYPRIYFHVD